MAKDNFYFPHDFNARNDRKLARLLFKHGIGGIGIFWCLIEMLYEEGGYLLLSECECIANEMRTQCDTLKDVIATSDLFANDGEKFWSNSVLQRLEKMHQKSEKARDSASKRWGDANAMRTQCDGNANKEKKSIKKKSIYIIPDFLNKDIWTSFEEMRKKKRAPLTDRARELILKQLTDFRGSGADPNKILEQSIMNSWSGVFPLKKESEFKPAPKPDNHHGMVTKQALSGSVCRTKEDYEKIMALRKEEFNQGSP